MSLLTHFHKFSLFSVQLIKILLLLILVIEKFMDIFLFREIPSILMSSSIDFWIC